MPNSLKQTCQAGGWAPVGIVDTYYLFDLCDFNSTFHVGVWVFYDFYRL